MSCFKNIVILLALLSPSFQTPIESHNYNQELDPTYWIDLAKEDIKNVLNHKNNERVAKNVIMFLGDGMSIPTLTAARIYKGQLNKSPRGGEEGSLTFEKFPNAGLIKTYNINKQVPDSASTATAYLCGSKAQFKTIGMAGYVEREDVSTCSSDAAHVSSVAQWAIDAGKDAGFVTTTRVTHATPAGTYAHVAYRDWEGSAPEGCKDIASQLVEDQPGASFKVIMGGGKANLVDMKESTTVVKDHWSRNDGRDLIKQWADSKTAAGAKPVVAFTRDELLNADPATTDYLMGIFDEDHVAYDDERDATAIPHIAEMTKKAIEMLSKNENGFFLLVEGGRIDHAHHAGHAMRSLSEVVAMDKAIETALEAVDLDETLIVVTADHAHTMSIVGYPERGNDIGGFAGENSINGEPYTTLIYGSGPGFSENYSAERKLSRCQLKIRDLTDVDTSAFEFYESSAVSTEVENHGGDDVAVYATGPMGHMFRKLHEQPYIAHVMGYSACMGPQFDNDECRHRKM